jgi:hypothetical protein
VLTAIKGQKIKKRIIYSWNDSLICEIVIKCKPDVKVRVGAIRGFNSKDVRQHRILPNELLNNICHFIQQQGMHPLNKDDSIAVP